MPEAVLFVPKGHASAPSAITGELVFEAEEFPSTCAYIGPRYGSRQVKERSGASSTSVLWKPWWRSDAGLAGSLQCRIHLDLAHALASILSPPLFALSWSLVLSALPLGSSLTQSCAFCPLELYSAVFDSLHQDNSRILDTLARSSMTVQHHLLARAICIT